MTDDTDEVTHNTPRPLPIEQLAPPGSVWGHAEALHWASIVVDPKLYDANHAGTIKLAAAYIKLAERLEALRADPDDLETITRTISHRAFADSYPVTTKAIRRLLDKQETEK